MIADALCELVGETVCGVATAAVEAAAQSIGPIVGATLLGLVLSEPCKREPRKRYYGFIRARWAQARGRCESWTELCGKEL